MSVNGYKFSALTGGGAGSLDAQDGDDLLDGDIALVMVGGIIYPYLLDDDSGATESSPSIIAPDTNAGTKRWILQRMASDSALPVGAVIPFIGGYFTDGSNGGFTSVLGNTAAAINALYNGDNLYVGDGSALNLSSSPIFNGSGRYLPNTTDDRFLMGDTAAGTTGGSSSSSHTHTTGSYTLTISNLPSHNHNVLLRSADYGTDGIARGSASLGVYGSTENMGGGTSHNHGTTGVASGTENRPKFLSCFYLMKVA